MTETMTDPTRTSGPQAFSAAAAGPGDGTYGSPEQKIAWLQAKLDAIAEKSDDKYTALLLSQASDRFSGRLGRILPLIPFFDGGGSGMTGGNNMLPLVLALTLSDDRHQDIGRILPLFFSDGGGGGNNMLPLVLALTLSDDRHQDIRRILPLIPFFDGGGSGMTGGNNMLPLVLALTLSDEGGGDRGARGGDAGGADRLERFGNMMNDFRDNLDEYLDEFRRAAREEQERALVEQGGEGGDPQRGE